MCDVSLDGSLLGRGALGDLPGLGHTVAVRALVWVHGVPVGEVTVPVVAGRCRGPDLAAAVADRLGREVALHLLVDRLAVGLADDLGWQDLADTRHVAPPLDLPSMTVAVCTRNRPARLRACLAALRRTDLPPDRLLVVDNAPSDGATERLVAEQFPEVGYLHEPRPGLDHARNVAIDATTTEVLAFVDDDTLVDARWVRAVASAFAGDPEVMCVTGLVAPAELETEAQLLFEERGGFGRGVQRRRYVTGPESGFHLGAGEFGTGANMAFRRDVFDHVGGFDPALDVGTPTNGGGDLEMFFRVLEEGHPLVYEPAAVVRHQHRRDRHALARQLDGHGSGLAAYLTRTAHAYPHRRGAVRGVVRWVLGWMGRRFLRSVSRPTWFPLDLQAREFLGLVVGPWRYRRARGRARVPARHTVSDAPVAGTATVRRDLGVPVGALPATPQRATSRVECTVGRRPVGSVDVRTHGRWWPGPQVRADLAHGLGLRLVAGEGRDGPDGLESAWADHLYGLLTGRDGVPRPDPEVVPRTPLPSTVTASIVIATRDRPEPLDRCLRALATLETERDVEVVVVDNHPVSGLTGRVLDAHPSVVRVGEPRQGSSYARNAGIRAARGDVVVTVDDDVEVDPGWLEALLAPFNRPDVGAVTGNVLPQELDTRAQRLFEAYGGLGRGTAPRVLDRQTFERGRRAVRTWELGATASAAFRRRALRDDGVGLFHEPLGAGMPAGVGEDTYLFYRLVRRGWVVAYTPEAVAWHRHRPEMTGLRRQLRAYSAGHVAYHLTTTLRERDLRGLHRVLVELPRHHARRVRARLRGRSSWPVSLAATEFLGHLEGPLALWRSHRRVRAAGRSLPLD